MFESTACLRCREQKLKCSRERPGCQRCSRLKTKCGYPDPPDRKALAKSRAKQRKRQKVQEHYNDDTESDRVMASGDPDPAPNPEDMNHSAPRFIISPTTHSLGDTISHACQRQLVDIYFDNIWNARILFCQTHFRQALKQDEVPRYLVLAICAIATQHLHPDTDNAQILKDYPNLHYQGRQWAEMAGAEALGGIDLPAICRVQACNILDLYWLAAGEPERSLTFSNIAFVVASAWKLERSTTENGNSTAVKPLKPWWQSETELRRRCFWIVWVGHSIKADQDSVVMFSKDRLIKLPLPRDIGSFSAKARAEDVNLSMIHNGQETAYAQQRTHGGLFVELIQLVVIWAWVGSYLESRRSGSARQTLPTLMDIDQSLSKWIKHLPSTAQYSRRNLYEHLIVNQQPQFVWIHCLHHQCRLVLRSSLVPQFSGMSWSGEHHVETISVSVQIALKAACAISDIASDLLAIECNFSQIPPFVGYCMYASAAIHVLFLFSKNVDLSATARIKLSSNVKVLGAMKEHWRSLEGLWARVAILCECQAMERHEKSHRLDPGVMIGFLDGEQNTNAINEHAQQGRDSGGLSEPLERSMLAFNLRLLPKSSNREMLQYFTKQATYLDPLSLVVHHSIPKDTFGATRLDSAFSGNGRSQISDCTLQNSSSQPGMHGIEPRTLSTYPIASSIPRDVELSEVAGMDSASLTTYSQDHPIMAMTPNTEVDNYSLFTTPAEGDWWDTDFDELNRTILALGGHDHL